jgi:acetylglutamate kinase
MTRRLVVKCGGAVAQEAADTILALSGLAAEVCVVHGGGPQISAQLAARGVATRFVDGRRVTPPEAIDAVRDSLLAVNLALCAALGPRAVGLAGDEIGLRAVQVSDLGLVGDPIPVSPPAVEAALLSGLLPVVAPLAAGPLNVNADEAATALAVGLGAERIVFVTDVPGVIRAGGVMSAIGADEADELIAVGEFEGGIVPKLRAAVTAARLGLQAEIGETAVTA